MRYYYNSAFLLCIGLNSQVESFFSFSGGLNIARTASAERARLVFASLIGFLISRILVGPCITGYNC